jgi:colanic acid/amylovoran biosynthesis glycosyltransferase
MQKPLRIAVFVGSFPVVSETFILRQITGLLDLGHDVEIFADVREKDAPLHPEVEKYQLLSRTTFMDGPAEAMISEMPVWPIWDRTWPPGAETSIHNSSRVAKALPKFFTAFANSPRLTLETLRPSEYGYRAASLSMLYRLARLCEGRRCFDVLHAHFGPVGNTFRFARKLWKAPLVVSFHGYDFSTLPRREGRDIYKKLFATVDAVTVNSDYTRGELQKLGCSSEKICNLPVGLDPGRFVFRERGLNANETVRILTVARLVEIKGIEFVIRGIAQLRRSHPNIRYDVIGDGPLRAKLQALTCELCLEGIVTLHGAKAGNEVKRFFDDAHVFVLTSVSVEGDQEGQGLVLQEAQACGLPVVCTRHGAFPEGILPDRSGFLVPERDPEAIAQRLAFLIDNFREWPEIGRAGRQYAIEKYDIRQLNAQLVTVYEDAMASFVSRK